MGAEHKLKVYKNEFEQAEKSFEEALQIYRKLAQDNPQTYLPNIGITLNGMGILQRTKNEFEQAEKSYQEALQIYQRLAQDNPQTYLRNLGLTLYNLGLLQRDKNEFEKAEISFKEALAIYRKLAEVNPQTYLPKLAVTQINMSLFYQKSKINKELSIQLVDEAITNLLPFREIPYIQNYLEGAYDVLGEWDVDVEKYMGEKLKTMNKH